MNTKAEAAKVLLKARALIAPKGAWTQNTYARGKSGRTTNIRSPHSVCFCSVGALHRIHPEIGVWRRARAALDAASPGGSILVFNDLPDTKQRGVLAVFSKAIKSLTAGHGRHE